MPRHTFRKIITSPEIVSQINPENIQLMERFLKEKSIRTSNKTIIVYRSNMEMFFCWNVTHNSNKFFVNIKKIEFSDFFSFAVDELKLGSSRLNNIRSTLSSISAFIEKFYGDTDYPSFRNVILKVVDSAPKETRREKTILTDEQIEDLLQHLKGKDKQQACWVALAITSGARFAELLAFETDMIDENRTAFGDLFLETTRQIKTKGRGKSGKLLYKYILRDKFLPYYSEWIIERDKILKEKNMEHNFLFIKQDGNPATPSTVRCWVESFEKYLKVPFYSHSCRHYLTTMLSKKNIPYTLIQAIMGWSSTEMCQIYDDSSAKDKEYPELDALRGKL